LDLLAKRAMAANWVIIPVGCPRCLTQPGQLAGLSEGLDDDVMVVVVVVVVETDVDLLAATES
jgi:hypothetical protein